MKMAKKITKTKKHIVKRRGHTEPYDERKAYASVYSACLSAHVPEQKAEKISAAVCKVVNKWIKSKKSITAHQLYAVMVRELKRHDKNAAFMYETHMDLS